MPGKDGNFLLYFGGNLDILIMASATYFHGHFSLGLLFYRNLISLFII